MVNIYQDIDCTNFAENKIRMEGICYNKRCAQGNAGQDSTCQYLQ